MARFLVFLVSFISIAHAEQLNESDYVHTYCTDGIIEYRLPDQTRVDCLTEDRAIEYDFDDKWAEALGQSLWYGVATNRQPGIVLILRSNQSSKNLKRLLFVIWSKKLDVDVQFVDGDAGV